MKFPERQPLFTVCCAGDDQVYMTGEGGTVYRGKGDHWERLWKAEMTVPYNDARWFDDRQWLASDYRLDVLEGVAVEPARHGGERLPLHGHMDVADGLLVVASLDEVHAFDGKAWRVLLKPCA